MTPPSSQAAYGSLLSLGISLDKYTLAATDQNVPLFYGLPATTLGAGGTEENQPCPVRTLEC